MSARNREPRQSIKTDHSKLVGHRGRMVWAGVGDYTRQASTDPAELVIFDETVTAYMRKGFGNDLVDAWALYRERMAARQ